MTVKIRPAAPEDKPGLVSILYDTPEFKAHEIEIAVEVMDSCLESVESGYFILVAEDDEIAGYVCYGPTPLTDGTWDVYWAAVARKRREQGIGRALIEEAEREIKKAGGRMALIETSSTPAYERTLHFHLSNGYREVARVPDFYSPGDDKLVLQKIFHTI